MLAQQSALVSILSKGFLELGVGVGWNKAKYEALGQDFHTRGQRLNEQIVLLRKLWTEGVVTYTLAHEVIDQMAINPLPDSPIPIWAGGWSKKAIDRAAKLADGWIPMDNVEKVMILKKLLLERLEKYGRDPETFKIMGRVTLGTKPMKECITDYFKWIEGGVSHIALSTTGHQESDRYYHQELIVEFLESTRNYRHKKTNII
ncbi:LLM class flavin-dependent oxidoreductase [Patescibacteria group bacterium]|nr:LLM class flavin-dependent oxidoreductase [Patescibacteria group bacterium]